MNWRTRRTKYSPSCGRKYRTVLTTGRDENTNCPLGNEHTITIDLFRGACAVKGNVQVAGHVKPAPFSRRDVTLGDVDGSLFHIKIFIFHWAS